jgi:hypothetical protein
MSSASRTIPRARTYNTSVTKITSAVIIRAEDFPAAVEWIVGKRSSLLRVWRGVKNTSEEVYLSGERESVPSESSPRLRCCSDRFPIYNEERNMGVAKNMLSDGLSVEKVIQYTDLPRERVEALLN